MTLTVEKDKKLLLITFVTAGTTAIAGILHVLMAPHSLSDDLGEGILFLVGGMLQIFWAIPVIKQWGRVWQVIGILGTTVFVVLWFATHLHGMQGGPPLGHMPVGAIPESEFQRGPPPVGIGILRGNALPIEVCQIAFIGLYAVLSKMISTRQKKRNF